MEVWRLTTSSARHATRLAAEAEAAGYDGLTVTDSQNLAGDCWVALTAMAGATTGLKLSTGVTNPITRHPAVTAAAALSLSILSARPDGSGRVAVGIGRGDSALAHLGRAPAPVALFERYLIALRGYLHGDGVEFADLGFEESAVPDVATLGLADTPDKSRLRWRRSGDPHVPVEVTASGPRVIGAAARSSDRVILVVGAESDRLRWGMEVARQARADAGMDPESLKFGAYLNVVPHPDAGAARHLAEGALTTMARFSVMHGKVSGPVSDHQRMVLERLHGAYNMNQHTRSGSEQAVALTPEFIDGYAVAGSPSRCIDRLCEIAKLGIDKVIAIGPSPGSDPAEAATCERLLAEEVVPGLRRALA